MATAVQHQQRSHRLSITLHSSSRSRSPAGLSDALSDETKASVKALDSNFSKQNTTSVASSTTTVKPIPSVRQTTVAAKSATNHYTTTSSMNISTTNRRSHQTSGRKVLQTDIDDVENTSPSSSQHHQPKQPSPQSSIDSAFTSVASGTSFMSRPRASSSNAEASGYQPRIKGPSFSSRRSSSDSESSGSEFELLDDDPGNMVTNGTSSPQAIRQCNRYGWFIDSEEAQDEETPLPSHVIQRRETKWIEMTATDKKWTKYVNQRFKTVRKRCRKGIPHAVRGRAWFYLCGGHKALERNPSLFHRLDAQPGNESINDEITKDLHRQFPTHEIFARKDGSGQQDLFRILKAYSILKPEIGYCQGQAPLAAVLLMIMPAEHAFLCLSALCDLYLQGYFAPGLETLQLHGDMLFSLLRKFYPIAYKILKKQKIEPVLYMTEWFMCLFARTLPWPVVLRVWDMFMCEGIIVIFKVGIVLIGSVLENEKKNCKSMYDTLQLLKNPPKKYQSEHFLLQKVARLDLSENELKREHAIQTNARRIKKIAEDRRRKSLDQERQAAAMAKKLANASLSKSESSSRHQDIIRKPSPPRTTINVHSSSASTQQANDSSSRNQVNGTNHGNNNSLSRTQTNGNSQRDIQDKYPRSISYTDSPEELRYSQEPISRQRSVQPRAASPHHSQVKQHRVLSSSSSLPSKSSPSRRAKETPFKSGTTR